MECRRHGGALKIKINAVWTSEAVRGKSGHAGQADGHGGGAVVGPVIDGSDGRRATVLASARERRRWAGGENGLIFRPSNLHVSMLPGAFRGQGDAGGHESRRQQTHAQPLAPAPHLRDSANSGAVVRPGGIPKEQSWSCR